jgi:hypothetical protein
VTGAHGRDGPELPPDRGEVIGYPLGKGRTEPLGRVLLGRVELRPGEAGVHVDRRVLPADPLRAREPADVEAVHPDQRSGVRGIEVTLGFGCTLGFGRGGVAGHQGEPCPSVPESMARQTAPHTVGRDAHLPQRSRASSAEIRLGPRPGFARENANIRCSTHSGSWFGILGGRRSRGRNASNPQVSTLFAQRSTWRGGSPSGGTRLAHCRVRRRARTLEDGTDG